MFIVVCCFCCWFGSIAIKGCTISSMLWFNVCSSFGETLLKNCFVFKLVGQTRNTEAYIARHGCRAKQNNMPAHKQYELLALRALPCHVDWFCFSLVPQHVVLFSNQKRLKSFWIVGCFGCFCFFLDSHDASCRLYSFVFVSLVLDLRAWCVALFCKTITNQFDFGRTNSASNI